MSTTRVRDSASSEARHKAWQREIRHARQTTRLLATALVALCVRILISGATRASVVTATILALLLLAARLVARYGQKAEPNAIQQRRQASRPK